MRSDQSKRGRRYSHSGFPAVPPSTGYQELSRERSANALRRGLEKTQYVVEIDRLGMYLSFWVRRFSTGALRLECRQGHSALDRRSMMAIHHSFM